MQVTTLTDAGCEKIYSEKEKDEILCVYDRHAGLVDGARWQEEKDNICYEEIIEEGARWKKEQMMKEALIGTYWDNSIFLDDQSLREKFKDDQKVTVIILENNGNKADTEKVKTGGSFSC